LRFRQRASFFKLRPVVALPGLDFGEFSDGCYRAEIPSDGRLLCLQPKP
jgi:hypothetical protein